MGNHLLGQANGRLIVGFSAIQVEEATCCHPRGWRGVDFVCLRCAPHECSSLLVEMLRIGYWFWKYNSNLPDFVTTAREYDNNNNSDFELEFVSSSKGVTRLALMELATTREGEKEMKRQLLEVANLNVDDILNQLHSPPHESAVFSQHS